MRILMVQNDKRIIDDASQNLAAERERDGKNRVLVLYGLR